jgi:Ankyrin repeats (many copies)
MLINDKLFMPFRRREGWLPDLSLNKECGNSILIGMAGCGDREIIKLILDKYPLEYEALGNCKLLHFKSAFYGNTPLLLNIANSKVDSALIFLDKDIVTDPDDMTMQINTADHEGKTPLMLAVAKGPSHRCDLFGGQTQDIIIDRLLELNADVTRTNNKGQNVLHYAAVHRDINLIKRLIAQGADYKAADIDGNTPLHLSNYGEEQADAFLYTNAGVFTRRSEHWHDENFRKELDTLTGQDTSKFIPNPSTTEYKLHTYNPQTIEQKQYEIAILTKIKKQEMDGARLLLNMDDAQFQDFLTNTIRADEERVRAEASGSKKNFFRRPDNIIGWCEPPPGSYQDEQGRTIVPKK